MGDDLIPEYSGVINPSGGNRLLFVRLYLPGNIERRQQ